MTDEDAFLAKILSNPADNVTRLVYADWLEERGDAESVTKSRFLRIDHELAQLPDNHPRQMLFRDELKQLMVGLPIPWIAVVARVKIENCRVKFEFVCPKQWNNLQATKDQTVRFCDQCRKRVHYCRTIIEARGHAIAGECVAIDSRLVRREGDLLPQWEHVLLGRIVQPREVVVEPEQAGNAISRLIRRFRRK